jgi:hypothetical protein
MFNTTRPSIPSGFDEAALLVALVDRLGEGLEGSKLFLPKWSDFKRQLGAGDVHAKCAYCEAVRRVTYELDVEHVRPKARVLRWKDADTHELLYPRRVLDARTGELVDEKPTEDPTDARPGYWWLAYRWSNYLLACKECNSGWKREFFPLVEEHRRWKSPSDEHSDEVPLLLDPSTPDFNASEHFVWNVDGTVEPLTERASTTVIACGLNRYDLRQERLQTGIELAALVEQLVDAANRDDRVLFQQAKVALRGKTDPAAPFTAMARFVVDKLFAQHGLPLRPWTHRTP